MWKDLENIYKEIFAVTYGAPMDELFTRYMYYKRAKQKGFFNALIPGFINE